MVIMGCRPAGPGPHQPREGAHGSDSTPGETRPPGLCRTMPQLRLDRPLAAPTSTRSDAQTPPQVLSLTLSSSCSSSSSSGSSVPLQLGLPVAVPPQYSCLKEVSVEALRARLRLLYHFSNLMYSSWRLLNLSPNNQVGAGAPPAAWWQLEPERSRRLVRNPPSRSMKPEKRREGITVVHGL